MRGVAHHLIDYVSPNVKYLAADWAQDASEKIVEIEARNKIPILVGGTGFYLRALREPFFESPKTDERLREKLKRIKETKGAEHLYKILQRVDKTSAAKLYPRDYVRVSRALEVFPDRKFNQQHSAESRRTARICESHQNFRTQSAA